MKNRERSGVAARRDGVRSSILFDQSRSSLRQFSQNPGSSSASRMNSPHIDGDRAGPRGAARSERDWPARASALVYQVSHVCTLIL